MVDFYRVDFSSSPNLFVESVASTVVISPIYSQAMETTVTEIKTEPQAPLDLSIKSEEGSSSHDLLRRSSSSSSASSGDSGFLSSDNSEIGGQVGHFLKRVKRREQNKVAAHAYRQRKKSFSELAEIEYEVLLTQNVFLQGQKTKLEEQIARMRQILERAIQISKEQEERERIAQEEAAAHHQDDSVILIKPILNSFDDDANGGGVQNHPLGFMRQNSWPVDDKNRKKEQNRIASQRFRERRRMEMSKCKEEANFYVNSNTRLMKRCEELERKIGILRKYFDAKNIIIQNFQSMWNKKHTAQDSFN